MSQVKCSDLKLHTSYWVCDIAMACGRSRNNVFIYNPTFFDKKLLRTVIIKNSDYRYFTTEQEAIELSIALEKDTQLMFKI